MGDDAAAPNDVQELERLEDAIGRETETIDQLTREVQVLRENLAGWNWPTPPRASAAGDLCGALGCVIGQMTPIWLIVIAGMIGR